MISSSKNHNGFPLEMSTFYLNSLKIEYNSTNRLCNSKLNSFIQPTDMFYLLFMITVSFKF